MFGCLPSGDKAWALLRSPEPLWGPLVLEALPCGPSGQGFWLVCVMQLQSAARVQLLLLIPLIDQHVSGDSCPLHWARHRGRETNITYEYVKHENPAMHLKTA